MTRNEGQSKTRIILEVILLASLGILLLVSILSYIHAQKEGRQGDSESTVPTFTYSDPSMIGLSISEEGKEVIGTVDPTVIGRATYVKGNAEKAVDLYRDRGPSQWPENVETESMLTLVDYGEDQVGCLVDPAYEATYEKIVLYIHGGAYLMDLSSSVVQCCDDLAMQTHAKFVLPLYRPVFNGTCQDACKFLLDVYKDLLAEGKEIIIMGESAGGGLALGFVEYAYSMDVKVPDKMVLVCPWLDATLSNPEIKDYEERDVLLGVYGLRLLGELWAGDMDVSDSRVSPINGQYGPEDEVPDTLLICGTEEIMYPDTKLLYDKLKEGGHSVKMVIGEGLFHVYVQTTLPEALTTRSIIEEFILE